MNNLKAKSGNLSSFINYNDKRLYLELSVFTDPIAGSDYTYGRIIIILPCSELDYRNIKLHNINAMNLTDVPHLTFGDIEELPLLSGSISIEHSVDLLFKVKIEFNFGEVNCMSNVQLKYRCVRLSPEDINHPILTYVGKAYSEPQPGSMMQIYLNPINWKDKDKQSEPGVAVD